MVKIVKNNKQINSSNKKWMKSKSYFGCMVFALCVSSPALANDFSNGFFSKWFSPESCIGKIDWFQVGMADGSRGIEQSYFSVYEQLCARRSKTPDREAYFTAYRQGVRSYCDPENIYKLARSGAVVISACEDSAVIRKAVQDGFANLLEQ